MGELSQTPFDPQIFEAEVALKLIPSETLPSVAQEAMEAGYDGPAVLRMAILEANAGWEIDQALQRMLAELGLSAIDPEEAALWLAKERARRILSSDENPLESMRYFHRLTEAGGYPSELFNLVCVRYRSEDEKGDPTAERRLAIRALENLLDPELGRQRKAEFEAKWRKLQEEEKQKKQDWPCVFDSPGMRSLLRQRWREKMNDSRPLIPLLLIAALAAGWLFDRWWAGVIYLVALVMIAPPLAYWQQYRRLKWERKTILWRRRYPEDKI
jgi:hypothetical protein